MNSKLIAIIAVVAMCGAALVGVGYAYSAVYDSGNQSANVTVSYVEINPGNQAIFTGTVSVNPQFDTFQSSSGKYVKLSSATSDLKIDGATSTSSFMIVEGNTVQVTTNKMNVDAALQNAKVTLTDYTAVDNAFSGKAYLGYVIGDYNSESNKIKKVTDLEIDLGSDATTPVNIKFYAIYEFVPGDACTTANYTDYYKVGAWISSGDGAGVYDLSFKATFSVESSA